MLLLPNSLDFGLVFVVGLKPPRSAQPGKAPAQRLTGRCILSGIRPEVRGLEGDYEGVESYVPRHSALGKDLIECADFRDAYRAPLSRSDLDVVDIFFGIFGQRPVWMNLMLVARNKVAGLAGLEVPTT